MNPLFALRRNSAALALLVALNASITLAAAALPTAATPPDLPDAAHVEEGCYLSTIVYLRKFSAAFPSERGLPVTIHPRNFPGPHTIALISWGGRWWGRDEDSGVFAIGHSLGSGQITDLVVRRATTAFEKHSIASALRRRHNPAGAGTAPVDADTRRQNIAVAATLLPFATERYTIKSAGAEIPLLFFRPGPGVIVSAGLTSALAAPHSAKIANDPVPPATNPPHFPDAAHVVNGCHISTLAFLARFATAHAEETGRPVVVRMSNADGSTRPHTVAVVTWRGALWCRDEFFGVFSLNLRATMEPELRRLINRIEPLLEKHARQHLKQPGAVGPMPAPKTLSAAEGLMIVRTAASLLPLATQIFWINHGSAEVPVLFFRPSGGEIAIYLPIHGTAIAECSISNDARVVELVADRLGYRHARVRAESATSRLALATSR